MAASITVDTGQLKRAAQWARPPKTPIPVLGCVRVVIAGGQLVIASYDWETCRLGQVPGTAESGQGAVLVPHHQLLAAIRACTAKTTQVRIDGDQVDLCSENRRELTRVS